MMKRISILITILLLTSVNIRPQRFSIQGTRFLLDNKPFQIMSGELHFQRIPYQYWKDRLLKAKAMGLNTIAVYVFWNAIEPEENKSNFTGNNDLRKFILLAKETGLFVLLRPGPYTCAEWDFGGLPDWLLSIPDIKIRCMDERYMAAVKKYIINIAEQIKDLQNTDGGPILMLQIENEYGSYGNDKEYLETLKKLWISAGITIPFYTADGATDYMLEAGTVKGAVIGLDPATSEKEFEFAKKFEPGVPVFCSEYYPGWLTHWGEKWAATKTENIVKDLKWLMDNKKSFNIYVIHGGTNFGWTAGANFYDVYQPHITSYDYDAPINEMGQPTEKYFAIRNLFASYLPKNKKLPELPKPLPVIQIPEIKIDKSASVFANLPAPLKSVQPKPMEAYHQYHGFILYQTKLLGRHSGKLMVTDLHDYGNVYVDGKFLGTLDRTKKINAIEIPKTDPPAQNLQILVEAMGRINFGPNMIDRKGITDRVTINSMTLMNWQVFNLPMDEGYLTNLKYENVSGQSRPGVFFEGNFDLEETGDTYLDMSKWGKGVVWVNGHNLGRYWNIGPQQRLFLPGVYLNKGKNKIIIFDMIKTLPATLSAVPELK
jgi:hypothetical protein